MRGFQYLPSGMNNFNNWCLEWICKVYQLRVFWIVSLKSPPSHPTEQISFNESLWLTLPLIADITGNPDLVRGQTSSLLSWNIINNRHTKLFLLNKRGIQEIQIDLAKALQSDGSDQSISRDCLELAIIFYIIYCSFWKIS